MINSMIRSILFAVIARAFGGRLERNVLRTVQTVDVHEHVLGLHDVAALADRRYRFRWASGSGEQHHRRRWHRIGLAVSAASVRLDAEFDTIGNADFAFVA